MTFLRRMLFRYLVLCGVMFHYFWLSLWLATSQ